MQSKSRNFIDVKPIKSEWQENDGTKLPPRGGIHLCGESKRKELQNQSLAVSPGAAIIELPRQTQSRRDKTAPFIWRTSLGDNHSADINGEEGASPAMEQHLL